MNNTFTFLLLFCSVCCFAQGTSQLTKDTTQANLYYQEYLKYTAYDTAAAAKLEKVIELYAPYQLYEKEIELRGLLAYSWRYTDSEKMKQLAEETIDLAKTKLNNDEYAATAYLSLGAYYLAYDTYKCISYLEPLLSRDKVSDICFFEAAESLLFAYRLIGEEERIKDKIAIFEDRIKANKNPGLDKYEIILNDIKTMYWIGNETSSKAILYGEESIRLHEAYGFPFGAPIWRHYDLNHAYANLGDIPSAKHHLELFIEKTDTTGYLVEDYYYFYQGAAGLYSNLKDKDNFVKYGEKSIEVLLPHAEKYKNLLAQAYDNMSFNYCRVGDYTAAKKASEEALKFGKDPMIFVHYLGALSRLEMYDKGLEYAQKGLQVVNKNFQAKHFTDNPEVNLDVEEADVKHNIYLLGTKALFLWQKATKENRPDLLFAAKETVELSILLDKNFRIESKGFQTSLFCRDCGFDENLIKIQSAIFKNSQEQEDLSLIFDYLEKYKGRRLLENFATNPLPEELANRERALNKNIKRTKQKIKLASADSVSFYQKKLFDISQEMETLIKEIKANYPSLAAYFYNENYVSAQQVQAGLDEATLLVSYFFSKKELYIYTISSTEQDVLEIPIPDKLKDDIEQIIGLLKNPLLVQRKKREDFIQTSHRLYQDLIQPIEDKLQGKSKLMIIPSGKLFYLPMEVLLASDDIKSFEQLNFLMKDYDMSYHYSATVQERLHQQTPITDGSFLGFAPVFDEGMAINDNTRSLDFDLEDFKESIDGEKFSALPYSMKEVKEIGQLFSKDNKNISLLLKSDATKKNLLSKFQESYQFVHIATHGLVNYASPSLSSLVCYSEAKEDEQFLFTLDIQLQKMKADLVVLSSCESGIGKLNQGEGLLALNRSFIAAGARNVLFSLWKVNDKYTAELMIDFYKNYLKTEDYSQALRQAKLKMLDDPMTANPRFWAPFVLIGE